MSLICQKCDSVMVASVTQKNMYRCSICDFRIMHVQSLPEQTIQTFDDEDRMWDYDSYRAGLVQQEVIIL